MLPPAWSSTTFSRPIVHSPARAQWLKAQTLGELVGAAFVERGAVR